MKLFELQAISSDVRVVFNLSASANLITASVLMPLSVLCEYETKQQVCYF
jgi:hypothetical protein